MTSRVTLISHAPTSALRQAAFPLDEPLDGQEAAKIVGLQWRVPRAQHSVTAPERRACETALALGMAATVERALSDCDYGRWKGATLEEITERDPSGLMEWLTDPAASPHGGESIEALVARVRGWMEQQAMPKASPDSKQKPAQDFTLAVTHPAVIRSAILVALDAPLRSFWRIDVAPLSLTDLRYNGRNWTVRSMSNPLRDA